MIYKANNLINEIVEKQIPCYFVSPHLDDAIFSAGGLISHLSGKTSITVINVFTSCGDGKSTLSAKSYLKKCNAKDAQRLYEIRLNEDIAAFSKMNILTINLGFTDALWRKTRTGKIKSFLGKILPEFNSLYPTYRFHIISGKIHSEDNVLENEIILKLEEIIRKKGDEAIVFCPMGFGDHVDHLIVKNACKKSFTRNLVHWTDFPYYLEKNSFAKDNSLDKFVFKIKDSTKEQLYQSYKSQVSHIPIDKTNLYKPETYYLNSEGLDNFDVQIEQNLNDELIKEWEDLWARSPLRHYFNSFSWFSVCKKTFNYSKIMVITCYADSKLVGIVPVVLTKKYGVASYGFAGNQYLAKSPVLLAYADSRILESMLEKLAKSGNYYFSEISDDLLNFFHLAKYEIGYTKSSAGFFLPLLPDAFKHIRPNIRKKIVKKIREEGENFKLEQSTAGFEQDLKLMKEIEGSSTKAKDFKDAFSDQNFSKLYFNLGNSNNAKLINHFLYYKDEAICYRSDLIYGKTYHGGGTSYKVGFDHLMPGKVSIYLLLPKLVEMGIEVADFSRGITVLKRDFTPFTYEQYLLFYSSNPFIMFWWKLLNSLKNYLETHPYLFEIVRKVKKRIESKMSSFRSMRAKNQESIVKV